MVGWLGGWIGGWVVRWLVGLYTARLSDLFRISSMCCCGPEIFTGPRARCCYCCVEDMLAREGGGVG